MPARGIAITILGLIVGVLCTGGSLNPPGAPNTTAKVIEELEPRVAINATNTPGDGNSLHRITVPGSYYLVGNVSGVAGKNGIEIAASGVSIDLKGFAMIGVEGSLAGIVTDGLQNNLVIRNGTLREWGRSGLDMTSGGTGNGSIVEGVRAIRNKGFGIRTNEDSMVRNCVARNQSLNGSLGSYDGAGIVVDAGSTLADCMASGNEGRGIIAGTNSTVQGCSTTHNSSRGIDGLYNVTVSECVANSNFDGFFAGYGSNVTGCVANANLQDGFQIQGTSGGGTRLRDSLAVGNELSPLASGVYVGSDCSVQGCAIIDNWKGLYCGGQHTVIEGNHLYTNPTGRTDGYNIQIEGSHNAAVRNSLLYAPSRVVSVNAWGVAGGPYGAAVSGDSGGTDYGANYGVVNWAY